MNKKIHLGLIVPFKGIKKVIISYKFTLNELSKYFENIYVINSEYLEFFPETYKSYENTDLYDHLNKNINLINPKNYYEFKEFIKNKKLVLIDALGNSFSEIKARFLLNQNNIDQIMISNVGNIQGSAKPILSKFLSYYFFKKVPYFITLFLYGIGILKKIKVRFVTNKDIFENFKKKKFSYVEKILLINSRSFDESKLNQNLLENNSILFLNPDINHPEWISKRGHINHEDEKKIYKIFEFFLDKLSSFYKKKVVVCIHPNNSLNGIQNLFKKYEIIQFKTPENIRKAHVVVFADSSSVVEAIILKKRIICITKLEMNNNDLNFIPAYHNQGLFEMILNENMQIDFDNLDKNLLNSIKNYEKFNNRFGIPDGKNIGVTKIVEYINNNF